MNDTTTTTRRRRVAAMLGLGGGLSVLVLWACSQGGSQPAVLDGTQGQDGGQMVTSSSSGGSVSDSGKPADAAVPMCRLVDGGCASVPNCGLQINVVEVAQTAPTAAGGTVVPGTYVMSDYSVYTGIGGNTQARGAWFQETEYLSLAGSDGGTPADGGAPDAGDAAVEAGPTVQVFQLIDVIGTDTSPEKPLIGTTTLTSPANYEVQYACPTGVGVFRASYTATPTEIQVFVTDPQGTGVITYTKN